MNVEEDTMSKPLVDMSREEIMKKCENLIAENEKLKKELKNVKENDNSIKEKSKKKQKESNQRPLDFSKYKKKRIAFRFLYLGWNYQGFASQENTTNTIEEELFNAFLKAKLVEDRSTANYSRCGRTDKGVSAFGQVIALDVRSNKKFDNEGSEIEVKKEEIPYVKALNRILPPDIRIIAHADIPQEFDARFSCKTRSYKYFFPKRNFDIQIMHEAAQKLVGEKDFRNFCKVDVGNNVNHFVRNVLSFTVRTLDDSNDPYFDTCVMEIIGMAFLWHQVRCMASVLFHIGIGLEKPEVIDFLLDIDKCPKRPQYGIASEIPLVLYDCSFDNVEWQYDEDFTEFNITRLHIAWTQKMTQNAALKYMLSDLQHKIKKKNEYITLSSLIPGLISSSKYTPLSERSVCEGIDRHLKKQASKRIKLEERCAHSIQSTND